MKNKEIQEARIKGYFVQATKEILKGEGLRTVSVRNVAERAGYSYATLYNYFKDIKDLIFECVKDFQEECKHHVMSKTESKSNGLERIKAVTEAYISFFVQYPGVFELFFIEKTTDIAGKQPTIEMILDFLNQLNSDSWEYLEKEKVVSHEQIILMKEQLNFVVSGILLLYLHRNYPVNYSDFTNLVNRQLSKVLIL